MPYRREPMQASLIKALPVLWAAAEAAIRAWPRQAEAAGIEGCP